ncbi:MAG: homogentisate 1,2-dioxygenase [Parvularcula sp.]|jgi:homogentisate 1,2-dioxygenase|nr:homogentisate 1,2-dioxygenase [Parvularcula sp.]
MTTDETLFQGGLISEADPERGFGMMVGFHGHHATEAKAGALPIGRNSPQKPPFGLYAEQLSGTAFTAPIATNRRSWLYRIRPSVAHIRGLRLAPELAPHLKTAPTTEETAFEATQLRWAPVTIPGQPHDFVEGLRTITTCGSAAEGVGIASHVYTANRAMDRRIFVNMDGEMVILPEKGAIRVETEMGILAAKAGEIVVVPRNVKFRVVCHEAVRGYVLENYGAPLTLPERGPIGANSLASPRDFLYPAAAYEDRDGESFEFCAKWQGRLFRGEIDHSPLDVVAWHGNHAPYKYDLRRFNTIGSISFDHPDPSIFTVLTSPSDTPGTANCDFVIFPDRWLSMEDTFRPPWYHINMMSEFMGLLYGVYDAKPGGFKPGGMSLHNAGLPHGPDTEAFTKATQADLKPEKLEGTMAFMFETRLMQKPTAFAETELDRDESYAACWDGLPRGLPR